ncbi:ATP-binding protein [Streptomyces sp. NPDC093221]|uniref:ATP-binding protein n=1 Tax=Streptomyces sp. NPDC093221 TaxID=3366032 RepID=UPI00380C6175
MTFGRGYQSRLELDSQPTSVRWVRAHTEGVLRSWSAPEALVENAVLIVSELATNAVQHAADDSAEACDGGHGTGSRFAVGLWMADSGLVVAVYDQMRRPPVQQKSSLESDGGRGLALVDALSARWGYAYLSQGYGKLVYAVLSPPGQGDTTVALMEPTLQRLLTADAGLLAAVSA